MGATHALDRHEAQADLVTQVRDIVGGKENVTRIFDRANGTYGLAAAIAAPNQPSKLRILHPMDADEEVKKPEKSPESIGGFCCRDHGSVGAIVQGFLEILAGVGNRGSSYNAIISNR